jgi:hypothetical protein
MASYLIILTICLPWLGGLVVWWVGDKHARAQHLLASAFAVMAGIASIGLTFYSSDTALIQVPMGSIFGTFTLIPDGLGVFLAAIATVVGSLAVIFSINYMHDEEQLGRYYSLILLFIGAMAGLGLSGSLLFMFFFWEITAFCSYALISFHNDDPKAVAGGIKALLYHLRLLPDQRTSCENSRSALWCPDPDRLWFPCCSHRKIGPSPTSHLVARCHGSTDAGDCSDPCSHDGECRRLPFRSLLSSL